MGFITLYDDDLFDRDLLEMDAFIYAKHKDKLDRLANRIAQLQKEKQ